MQSPRTDNPGPAPVAVTDEVVEASTTLGQIR